MNDPQLGESDGKISDLEYMLKSGRDRRQMPRIHDRVYQVSVALNVLAWLGLVGALIMFHFARPELITGFQEYLGVEGRDTWSEEHVDMLNYLLQSCLVLTLVSILISQKRSRRSEDSIGKNLFVLTAIVILSLLTLQITLG